MPADSTEDIRRTMIETGQPAIDHIEAEANQEKTWDTTTLQQDFEVLGFMAPFVIVRRKADGVRGSLEFTHSPRVYFNWQEEG